MFNHAAKEELIDRHDVPYFPMAAGVDNIRRTVASKELLENILNEIEKNLKKDANPKKLHPYILFLAGTGKRSGQTAELTWADVNEERIILALRSLPMPTKHDVPIPFVDSQRQSFNWS